MSQYHQVVAGECLAQIAQRYHFSDWHTIYDDPNNADLRAKRPDPNLLLAGDRVFIPDPKPQTFDVQTGRYQRFRLTSGQRSLKLLLLDGANKPLPQVQYTLTFGKESRTNSTDSDGKLEEFLPVHVRSALLVLADGTSLALEVGQLNPMDDVGTDVSGVQARLMNLGFFAGPVDGRIGPATEEAIRSFQDEYDLAVDAECSPAFKAKLKEVYGC